NLPGVAGTDAHNPTEMWTVYTEIKAQPSIEDILKAIRKGFVKPVATKRATLAEMRGGI
ncbi:histidinol-phosphatase, partial [Candidatus Bathyarchaeota archaeon]|nr:histidinol-phosphatase [Candidatus Bathyarchaeota archaeon]